MRNRQWEVDDRKRWKAKRVKLDQEGMASGNMQEGSKLPGFNSGWFLKYNSKGHSGSRPT